MIAGKAIYYLLTNDGPISAIVGTRVFPEIADQEQTKPYVVYSIRSNDPSDVQAAPSALDTASVEVNCYALSYTAAIDLSDAVRTCLDRRSGTYSGVNVQSIQYITEVMDFEEPQRLYRVMSDYEVRIDRSNYTLPVTSAIRPDLYIRGAVYDEPRILALTDGAAFTVNSDDHLLFANYASASGTAGASLRLPAVSGNEGREIRVKTGNHLSNQRVLNIRPAASDVGVTIDGSSGADMDRSYDGITVHCIGGQWYITQRKSK
jgi:hypothetical protein